MNRLSAFVRLVRWPNLVFIALTQILFHYCVYQPLFGTASARSPLWIVAASVSIAAAGYIINDYFDLNIDQINKPRKNVFAGVLHRRWAIVWHFGLSFFGVVATALGVGLQKWYLVLANLACVGLLWLYSTSFKRQLLIGNVVISLLTAWTVLILFFAYAGPRNGIVANDEATIKFFRIAFMYAAFAFVSSLIREAVKDMEDLEGDARYGCRTLPIVAGLRATKIYVAIWSVVLLAALVMLQLYVIRFGWWPAVVYGIAFIIFPLLLLLRRLAAAGSKGDFSFLSSLSKLIMLTGILSMLFFRFYF